MKNKILSLFGLSIIFVAVLVSFASAGFSNLNNAGVFTISNVDSPDTVLRSSGSFEITFDVENTGGADHTISYVASSVTGGSSTLSFSPVELSNVVQATTVPVTVTVDFADTYEGTVTGTISADPDGVSAASTFDFTVEVVNGFCSNGSINDDDLVLNVDISNKGEGEDEEWQALDTIEVEVEIENNKDEDGDGDLSDVVFEFGLFREGSSSSIADEMDWISTDEEEIEVGDVDEGDDTKHVFEFRVNPSEADEGDYILMVKAYPDGDEADTCIDYSDDLTDFGGDDNLAEIAITSESDTEKMVVVDEQSYPALIDAFCGETTSFSADVWNIGDDDFVDAVKVSLMNTELGIDLEEVSSGDLDAGDNTQVTFAFDIPQDAEKKTYTLSMKTFYDYDEDDDTYDEVSEDEFFAYLNVQGDCFKSSPATVTANLQSGGKAGENLVVTATVKNTGTESATYIVNAAGYSTWAESATTTPGTFTLNAGESKDVTVTLMVNEDASGENTFNLEVVSGNELAVNQPVTVNVEKSNSLSGLFGGDNGYTGVLALVTLILVVAIIIVLVKLFRK